MTRQLVALGYVEDHEDDAEKAANAARLEADYNLAQVFLSMDRADEAVPLLAGCLRVRPWESRYIHQLANALEKAGRPRQSLELLLAAYPESDPERPLPVIRMIMARALLAMGGGGPWQYPRCERDDGKRYISGKYAEFVEH
jgi:tetratricopeptide (TPR) repeat protein